MDGNSSRGNPDSIFWIALSIALCVVLLVVALGPREGGESRTPSPEQGSSERAPENAPAPAPVDTAPVPEPAPAPSPVADPAPAPEGAAPEPAPVPVDKKAHGVVPAPAPVDTAPAPGPAPASPEQPEKWAPQKQVEEP
jgi:hypothetical protein